MPVLSTLNMKGFHVGNVTLPDRSQVTQLRALFITEILFPLAAIKHIRQPWTQLASRTLPLANGLQSLALDIQIYSELVSLPEWPQSFNVLRRLGVHQCGEHDSWTRLMWSEDQPMPRTLGLWRGFRKGATPLDVFVIFDSQSANDALSTATVRSDLGLWDGVKISGSDQFWTDSGQKLLQSSEACQSRGVTWRQCDDTCFRESVILYSVSRMHTQGRANR